MHALSAWPRGLRDCFVQLSRGSKELSTLRRDAVDGRLLWNEALRLCATLYAGPLDWDAKVRIGRAVAVAKRRSRRGRSMR